MRPFGCPVTILNTIDHLGKFDGKANEGFFIGYSLNNKAFRVFNSRTMIVEENLHIRLSESTPNVVGSGPDWLFDISSHDDGSKPSNDDEKKVDEDPRKESECNDQEKEDNVNSTNNVNAASTNEVNVVGGKTSIELLFDANMHALEDYSIFYFLRNDEDDDHSLDQVIGDFQSATQTRKMSKNLEEHGYEEPKKALNGFLGIKKDERGIVIRNKARLVAQGYTQEEGIDYDEVFSRVARIEAIRLFLAYALFKDFVVYQMDVKSAFLYGMIEEEVYVGQPPRFEDLDFPDRVYKVKKALYRLHQAPRAWYETLSTYLLDNGFQRGRIDKTFFIKRHKGDILLVQVYVDDIIFGSTKKELCFAFEKLMHEKFQMSSIGELTFFLGLQVKQKKDGIFISQDKYVDEIVRKFRFTEVKTASIPMETQKHLLKDEDGEEVDVYTYRSMIGSLMHLTSSRPDIMFVVCAYARYQVNPKISHLHAVKNIFRYLKGQPKLGLWYLKDSPFYLVAYTNSDYVGASLDRKSTTGGCQFLRCRLISWQCKKQTVVANSIIEVEYVAASSCFGQGRWIQNQLLDYGKNLPIYQLSKMKCVKLMMEKLFRMELELTLAKTINGEVQLHALVDGKKIIVTESSVRRDLQLANEEGVDCLPNSTIFEQLTLMGDPIKIFANEAIHKELGDSLVRAATTASSIEAEHDNEVFVAKQEVAANKKNDEVNVVEELVLLVNTAKLITNATTVSAAKTTTATIATVDDITLAQALMEIKSTKPKEEGVVIQELGESTTTISSQLSSQQSLDKGKGVLIEPANPMKKKDLIRLDEEVALKLQAEFDEEERLARQKAKKEKEANIALIETWDDIPAKIDVDYKLAERMQAQEQEELSIEEKATLFQQLFEKRRKHFAAKRAEEKRNKPPTKSQQRQIMCTYLKNMEGYKLKDLKLKEFDSIQ
ncbi:putative ribonuclease H-like domain-containing protein [Tanacetum coccineum]